MLYEITLFNLEDRDKVWELIRTAPLIYTGWIPFGKVGTLIFVGSNNVAKLVSVLVDVGVEFTLKAERR
jgi:hypothetical protein